MKLNTQKRLAGKVLKCSPKRIKFDTAKLEDIKKAISKQDIKDLISGRSISKVSKQGISKARSKKLKVQKRKGRRRGYGSRKGKQTARLARKTLWVNKIRCQRTFLAELKEKSLVENKTFRLLYKLSNSGFFRSKRHIKLYIDENRLIVSDKK